MSVSLKKQMEFIKKAKSGSGTRRESAAINEKGNDEEKEKLVASSPMPKVGGDTMHQQAPSSNLFAPLVQALVINETESDFTHEIKQIFKVNIEYF